VRGKAGWGRGRERKGRKSKEGEARKEGEGSQKRGGGEEGVDGGVLERGGTERKG